MPLSLIDRPIKRFPCLYRSSMGPRAAFPVSIAHRWTRQKISMPLSLIDRPAKRFPCLYRSSIDPQKDFHASIAHRWPHLLKTGGATLPEQGSRLWREINQIYFKIIQNRFIGPLDKFTIGQLDPATEKIVNL